MEAPTSARWLRTVVVAVAVLLPGIASLVAELTEQELVINPSETGATTMLNDTDWPLLSVPKFAETMPPPNVAGGSAETNVTLAGRRSANWTLVAGSGPWLVTVTAYVMLLPGGTTTGSGESTMATPTSAPVGGVSRPGAQAPPLKAPVLPVAVPQLNGTDAS